MTCRCASAPCRCGPSTTPGNCNPGGPSPTQPVAPANTQPVDSLACTLLGGLQATIDYGRQLAHAIGARPYRVRMVWQEQDRITAKWSAVHERELVPVRIETGRESLETLLGGSVPTGTISLREISPIQVDELTLRGYIQGEPWGAEDPSREFFFEIQQIPYCATDPEPERYRFVLDGVPELRTDSHEWRVSLVAAFGRRERDGTDSTVPGELYSTDRGAMLVP
jgi:hypothetical protein